MSSTGKPYLIVVANVVNLSSALIVAPALARTLGPAGRGETAAVIAAINILPIVIGLGLPLISRRTAALGAHGPSVRAARILVLFLFLPSGLVAAALALSLFSGLDTNALIVTLVGLTLAPFSVLWMVHAAAAVGAENYLAVFTIRVCQPTLFAIYVYAGLALSALSVPSVIVGQVLANVATLVVASVVMHVPLRGPVAAIKPTLKEGVSLAGGSIAEAFNYRLDQILILPLAGATQAGYYSVALMFGAISPAAAQAIAAPNYRRAVTSVGVSRDRILASGIREVGAIALVVTTTLAICAQPLIFLVFGPSFTPSLAPTLIYLPGALALSIAAYCSLALAGFQRGSIMTLGQVGATLLGVLLLVVLSPQFGAVGAAIGSSISYILLAIFLASRLNVSAVTALPRPEDFRSAVRRLIRNE